jgi:hypothetical protein
MYEPMPPNIRTMDQAEAEHEAGIVYGYVSSDGRAITEWPGGVIGRVISRTTVRLPRWSHIHGSTMTHYRVKLNDGRIAYGRSSPGILIRLRPTKDAK